MIGLRIRVIRLGPTIQVTGFRIQVLGTMVGLNTLGDMQVRFQVGSDHLSDWIQDPSAWSHGQIVDPTIRVIRCNRKLNQASVLEGRSGPPPFQSQRLTLPGLGFKTLN